MAVAVLVLALALTVSAAPSPTVPRGVSPDKVNLYSGTGGVFKCLDGSATIPFSQVNDNYCDCVGDGSDEPGTSACYHGSFYCANRGFTSKQLSSSFVDDGVCDCCDGSDEARGKCKNTCLEQSSTEKQAIRDKVAKMQANLDRKAEMIAQAQQQKSDWAVRAPVIHSELSSQRDEIKRLEAAKAEADAAAAAERQLQAEEAAAQQAAADAAANLAGQSNDATDGNAHQEEAHHEETDEERGRRIASQWTHDPEAAAVPVDEVAGDVAVEEEVAVDGEAPVYEEEQHHHHHHQYQPPAISPTQTAANQAQYDLQASQHLLTTLEQEAANIQRYHLNGAAFDFGPGDLFLPLAGRCLTDAGTHWHYEACFFDKATQSETGGANKVSLGTWRGFNADYTQAYFAGGDACANAPARSFTLTMVCGEAEAVYGASEPSTCVYTAWFSTPAACKDEDLAREKAQLLELEKYEAEIRREIEAAEKAAHDEL